MSATYPDRAPLPLDIMTTCSYDLYMRRGSAGSPVGGKTVKIAELRARFSAYLKLVRGGRSLVVVDRETPIARLVPIGPASESLASRRPLRRYASLQRVPLPPCLDLEVDVVDLLLEERQTDR
jgi:prevent-host-death family protein